MPVYGDLDTMPLTDVLQWIGVAQKTGVLEVERGVSVRRIEFNKGFVGGCDASDHGAQLGPMLVARGMITQEQLERAVAQHETGGNRLGFVLVEQGAMEEQEVRRMITMHIEQTIHCLFEWDAAMFRFYEGATFDPVRIEVSLSINDMLLKSLQYQDELKLIRQAFASSGIVLRATEMAVPEELTESEMSRKIFESIDGRRTIAEVVVQARASEILVLKLLYRLQTMGLIEVAETRPVSGETATLLDPLVPLELQRMDGHSGRLCAQPADTELRAAGQLMEREEYVAAAELLQAAARAHPADDRIPSLLSEVEAARWGHDAAGILPPSHVPVRLDGPAQDTLDSEESFLLSLIDGASDVRSIVSLAAMRESEVLGSLELLMEKGWIALRGPSLAEATEGQSSQS